MSCVNQLTASRLLQVLPPTTFPAPSLGLSMEIRGRRNSEKGRVKLVAELHVHLEKVTKQEKKKKKKTAWALVCMINSDSGVRSR